MVIDKDTLDTIATLEAQAILEGLRDPEIRRNPAFLEKARKFLKENRLITQPNTPYVADIKKITKDLPVFDN